VDCTPTEDEEQVREISLIESLDEWWLKLPLTIMQHVGPAVQTLAGILAITNRETFVPVEDIAKRTRLPISTVRKHLRTLIGKGWVENLGRQRTRAGYRRRTVTIRLPKKTRDALEPYGILPWWACCSIRGVGRLPWCAKALLSVVLARLCSLKAAVEQQDGHGLEADDVMGSIENMGGEDRFRFSLDRLARDTGLSRPAIIRGKRWLYRHRIAIWSGTKPTRGQDTAMDVLAPSEDFRVRETPASPGKVWLDFVG